MTRRLLPACICLSLCAFAGPLPRPELHVRTLQHLTSYASPAGTSFAATVISPYTKDGEVLLPTGAILHGSVRTTHSVGRGILRERATLEIEFHSYELPDGRLYHIDASLISVDNARERVNDKGQIRGILAAASPQGFIQGVWYRPGPTVMLKTVMGVTGASGKVFRGLGLGPIGAGALMAVRFATFRMPEPEIALPVGTELNLRVSKVALDAPSFGEPHSLEAPPHWVDHLADKPFRVHKSNGKPVRDITNVAFVGSAEQLETAFQNAGWSPADRMTRSTFARGYRAFVGFKAYPTAPVSKLLHEGEEADFVFQKSLNTMAKRHHIRIWRAGSLPEGEVWIGAGTHDTNIVLNRRNMGLTHNIDYRIDIERTKIVDDLAFTGCADTAAYVSRPSLVRTAADEDRIVTDGRLAVLSLRDCSPAAPHPVPPMPKPRGGKLTLVTRRFMLETRYQLMRNNIYYWGVKGIIAGIRHRQPLED